MDDFSRRRCEFYTNHLPVPFRFVSDVTIRVPDVFVVVVVVFVVSVMKNKRNKTFTSFVFNLGLSESLFLPHFLVILFYLSYLLCNVSIDVFSCRLLLYIRLFGDSTCSLLNKNIHIYIYTFSIIVHLLLHSNLPI